MFDFTNVEVQDDFAPIPKGIYPAYVDEATFKTSKAGAEYLNVKFKIFGEKYGNRVVWNIYNVMHPTDKVRNIALSDLKKMFIASGFEEDKLNITTKEQLVDTVGAVRCMIKIDTKTDDYGTKNVIKGYQELDDANNNASDFAPDDLPF